MNRAFALLAILTLLSESVTQVRWEPISSPMPRYKHAMTYDSVKQRAVVFSGVAHGGLAEVPELDVWAYEKPRWVPIGSMPFQCTDPLIQFDPHLNRFLLHGCHTRQTTQWETWTWDGATWLRRGTPTVLLTNKRFRRIAYDPVRRVTTMVCSNGRILGEVEMWDYNGATWVFRNSLPGPPIDAQEFQISIDPIANQLLWFGGANDETWIYDGTKWTQSASIPPNPIRDDFKVAQIAPGTTLLQDSYRTFYFRNGAWTELTPGIPQPRKYFGMVADPVGGGALLFGGNNLVNALADTWRLTSSGWTLESPGGPPRYGIRVAAHDTARQRILVNPTSATTYEFDGQDWHAYTGLTPDGAEAMAYHPPTERTIALGTNGTWEWDGATWSMVATVASSPDPRASMCFDGRDLICFSYMDGRTWLWQQNTKLWTEQPTRLRPSSGGKAHLIWDARRRRIVLLTWTVEVREWTGSSWQIVGSMPGRARREGYAAHYSRARGRVMMHGGNTSTLQRDTLEWNGNQWSTLRDFHVSQEESAVLVEHPTDVGMILIGGNTDRGYQMLFDYPSRLAALGPGCGGATGAPILSVDSWDRPWGGRWYVPQVRNLPPGATMATLILGVETDVWNGQMLPLDLGITGMPGCAMRLAPLVMLPTSVTANHASWRMYVPAFLSLRGDIHHATVLTLDPTANALGVALSNSITAQIGSR